MRILRPFIPISHRSFSTSTSNDNTSKISFDVANLHYQPEFDTLNKLNYSVKHHSNLQFNDKIRIKCIGGSGGQGCVSFEPHARKRGKPNGGTGGVGGDIVIQCVDKIGGFHFSKRTFQLNHIIISSCSNKKHSEIA